MLHFEYSGFRIIATRLKCQIITCRCLFQFYKKYQEHECWEVATYAIY